MCMPRLQPCAECVTGVCMRKCHVRDVGRDRVGESGDAAEELAQKVRVGFGIDVVCPMVGDLEHGLSDSV